MTGALHRRSGETRAAPALGAGRALPSFPCSDDEALLSSPQTSCHPRENGDLKVSGHEVPAFAGMTAANAAVPIKRSPASQGIASNRHDWLPAFSRR